jgi:23S rRNA (pseudouridine1915-N3)-methyltransferase
MTRRTIRLLSVGRPRLPYWKAASARYLDRLRHWLDVREAFVAEGEAASSPAARRAEESARLLAAITPGDAVICLDERGTSFTSPQVAAWLARLAEDGNRVPCFVVGGAYGLDGAVREKARHLLALGPMTLPRELARVVLLEQLYRAETIARKLPYHHD